MWKNAHILDWRLAGDSHNFLLYNKNYEEKNYDVTKLVPWIPNTTIFTISVYIRVFSLAYAYARLARGFPTMTRIMQSGILLFLYCIILGIAFLIIYVYFNTICFGYRTCALNWLLWIYFLQFSQNVARWPFIAVETNTIEMLSNTTKS